MSMKFKKWKPSKGLIASILKKGGELNQGSKPMEFVLSKTNRNHTLDGYKLVEGKLQPDKTSSVRGYLRPIEDVKGMNQYGENLYSKMENGGLIFKKGGSVRDMPCNKPKRTSDHKTKSHVVKACEGGKEKVIRFGQQGVSGSPKKKGESAAYANRRKRFKARHAKNIAKGKMSAAFWANKVKW